MQSGGRIERKLQVDLWVQRHRDMKKSDLPKKQQAAPVATMKDRIKEQPSTGESIRPQVGEGLIWLLSDGSHEGQGMTLGRSYRAGSTEAGQL